MATVIEYVPGGAFALVGPQSVDANTIQADVGTELLAFVDVLAHMILRIESCATWAHALFNNRRNIIERTSFRKRY